MPDITHDQMEGGVPTDGTLHQTAVYSGAHLARIRELYIGGAPITLPAQFSAAERAELDQARADALRKPGGASSLSASNTPAAASSSSSQSNTSSNAARGTGSTAAPTSAGTAGSTGAQ